MKAWLVNYARATIPNVVECIQMKIESAAIRDLSRVSNLRRLHLAKTGPQAHEAHVTICAIKHRNGRDIDRKLPHSVKSDAAGSQPVHSGYSYVENYQILC